MAMKDGYADLQLKGYQEYYDRLYWHDWFYDYTEDHSVWQRAQTVQATLEMEARYDENKKRLFDEMKEHKMNKGPQPQRP